ncbi:PREDICTED: uncharacterized protein LOC104789378 [Camelina sativa]|uniref:Uncharacterized protein LOC104789378 n=1 Tax=Camelina sativa TaxID=90675 RepID=A0ABM0ZBR3_CAMSA|nr:PREDICTED: uncharacterized protein LOC104789378 [Camelina sativa]
MATNPESTIVPPNDTSTPPALPASTSASTEPSPYYLHPSDNPGALITSVLLQGDNYSEWATELSNSLQAKHKLGFINGSFVKPAADPDLSRWLATNSMIVGWIRTSIDPKIRFTVTFVLEAHKLWDNLQHRFSVKSGVRIHQLRNKINNCRQNGQTVQEFFGRPSKLWEDLDTLKITRSCSSDTSPEIEKEREDIRVHKFLFGLDESRFRNVHSKIIDEDPLPDLNIVYSRVIREEQHLNSARTTEVKAEVVGFSVTADGSKLDDSRGSIVVAASARSRDPNRYCSRKGHDNSECFLLHGYPEWWQEQQRQNASSGSGQRGRGGNRFCNSGRGRGRSNPPRAISNNATTPSNVGWNTDQITQLLQLLQTPRTTISFEKLSGKANLYDIIIDTGASHHMTGYLSLLTDVFDILPSAVTFPDGKSSRAVKCGKHVISRDYYLLYVLYVPNFNCTLISVSRLLKQTGCIAIFTDTLCVLQDRFTKTLIGTGEEHDGVYYFTGVTAARVHRTAAHQISSSKLWHRRLGYPSSRVLSSLPVFTD